MKAAFFEKHGGPEVLQFGEQPTPEPRAGEVRVRLRASALNRMDLWVRNGWPGIRLAYPHISGADGAGEIDALGAEVEGWSSGDRVVIDSVLSDGTCEFCRRGEDNRCVDFHLLGETVRGTLAEYVVVPARNLLRLPPHVTFEAAAATALVFHTAWHSLITLGALHAGESVLIVGASGGVNTASIQIARLMGAQVLVVGSSAAKLEQAQALGAQVLIDRSQEADWSRAVYLQTGKRGVDVVVDNVGTTFPLSMRALRKGGRLLTVGNTGGARFEVDNRFIFGKHLSLIGSTMGTRADFDQVMGLVFNGRLAPVIDRTYPLAEARQGETRLERDEQFGKIVLIP
jgi:NADPH:quinone reductase-like Zn-dependent oxidoreductase